MAERLTRNNKVNFYFHDEASNMVYYKLQALEDIMEKYAIESVEELDDLIANYRTSPILTEEMIKEIAVNEQRKVIQSMIKEITEKECNQLYTELNTWKRACELAVLWIAQKLKILPKNIKKSELEFENEMIIEKNSSYFYQQAKKEGENETKNENNKSGN